MTVKTELELFNLLDEGNSSYTLAALLQSLHRFLSSFNNVNEFTGDEEEYRYYVQGLMERRNQNDMDKFWKDAKKFVDIFKVCLLYTSPSPRDATLSRMPSSA